MVKICFMIISSIFTSIQDLYKCTAVFAQCFQVLLFLFWFYYIINIIQDFTPFKKWDFYFLSHIDQSLMEDAIFSMKSFPKIMSHKVLKLSLSLDFYRKEWYILEEYKFLFSITLFEKQLYYSSNHIIPA